MKVRVFEESKKVDKPLLLKLVQGGSDSVLVVAVDESGQTHSNLLSITKEGVRRSKNVDPALGIKLDGLGGIAQAGE